MDMQHRRSTRFQFGGSGLYLAYRWRSNPLIGGFPQADFQPNW